MKIGVPTERKTDERRVALAPSSVRELVRDGHEVIVEAGAGEGCGVTDQELRRAGARIGAGADRVYRESDVIVKVKEPSDHEVVLLREDQLLFTYQHLAAAPGLTAAVCASGATCLGYETVRDEHGRLALLAPMSEIAGILGVHVAAETLRATNGGSGVLLGAVSGVRHRAIVIIGAGAAGSAATRTALGMGARVILVDRSTDALRAAELRFGPRVETVHASALVIEELLPTADAILGCVLVPGARAPRLLGRDALGGMRDGSVLVDISIDQGGCFDTSRPTTHKTPTFTEDGVVHYCVTNRPGAVPVTATQALSNATLPYVRRLAEGKRRSQLDQESTPGLQIHGGRVDDPVVADPVGRDAGRYGRSVPGRASE